MDPELAKLIWPLPEELPMRHAPVPLPASPPKRLIAISQSPSANHQLLDVCFAGAILLVSVQVGLSL